MKDAEKESSGFPMEVVLEELGWDEKCFLQTQKCRQGIAVWASKLQIAYLDGFQVQRLLESQTHLSHTLIQTFQAEALALVLGLVLPLFRSLVAVLAQVQMGVQVVVPPLPLSPEKVQDQKAGERVYTFGRPCNIR